MSVLAASCCSAARSRRYASIDASQAASLGGAGDAGQYSSGHFFSSVVRAHAELEDVLLRDADVLDQLPRGVLPSGGHDASKFRRDTFTAASKLA